MSRVFLVLLIFSIAVECQRRGRRRRLGAPKNNIFAVEEIKKKAALDERFREYKRVFYPSRTREERRVERKRQQIERDQAAIDRRVASSRYVSMIDRKRRRIDPEYRQQMMEEKRLEQRKAGEEKLRRMNQQLIAQKRAERASQQN